MQIQKDDNFADYHHDQTPQMTTGEEGVSLFRDLVDEDSSLAALYHKHAVSLCVQGKYTAALLECEKAFQLDPDNVYILNNMGYLLLKHAMFEDALPFFQQAITITPYYALAHNNLGNA